MVKKSDLKKLNSIMQEGNEFKNDRKYNKAIEKYFEALNFVKSRVKDPIEKQDELSSIKSQIDQVYSIEIIDIVDNARENIEKKNFKNAFKNLEEATRIADKIEDLDMRNYEIKEISFLTDKFKIDMAISKALETLNMGELDKSISSLKETLQDAERLYKDLPNKTQVADIKTQINEIYTLKIQKEIDKANQFKVNNKLDKALKLYQESLNTALEMFESDKKTTEILNLKNLANQIYANRIKPLIKEGNQLFNEGRIDISADKFEKAQEIALKMYPSSQKDSEIQSINKAASKVLNPVYIERMKPIIDKGKELIIKEFFEDNITIVNEAIDKFTKALEIAQKMAKSSEKDLKIKEIKGLIIKTCRARINFLKDQSLQKIAQREYDKAVNELYAAMSVAKKIPVPEEENEDYNELKQSVNDVYNSRVDEILKEGTTQQKNKNYDKAIEIFNEALKITDKMYLTDEMENVVNKIKGMIYQAELKHLVGRGDMAEEQKKFERELERLNKKMEYAQTIDDKDRRFAEMEKIKTSIDEVHYSEIKLLVEQGIQMAGKREYEEGFSFFEKAMKVHELIESPEFRNKVPIKFHYKTELINKARLEILERRYEDAIKDCEKAIELDSTFIDAYYEIGNANIRKKSFDDAISSFEKVISLKSNHVESWNKLGYAHELKKEFEKAIKAYNKAIELNPNFAEAHYNLGNALKETERHNAAIQSYQKATQIEPKLALGWLFLGAELIGRKEYFKAIKSIQKALDVKPSLKNNFESHVEKLRKLISEIERKVQDQFESRNN